MLAVIQGKPTGPAYLRTLCEMAGYDVRGEVPPDDGTGKVTFTIIANGRDGPLPETPDDDNPDGIVGTPAQATAVDSAALAGEGPVSEATPSSDQENTQE